jgi:hypothetical protein
MGFLDKAKEAAEQAATKARQGVDEVQAKRGASQAYGELGRETYRLIEAGEVSHPALTEIADRIREAEAGAPADEPTAAPSEPAEPPPPAAPPAMPS